MVYLQSAVYLTQRVDGILAHRGRRPGRARRRRSCAQRIDEALALDGDQNNVFALFSPRRRLDRRQPRTPAAGAARRTGRRSRFRRPPAFRPTRG